MVQSIWREMCQYSNIIYVFTLGPINRISRFPYVRYTGKSIKRHMHKAFLLIVKDSLNKLWCIYKAEYYEVIKRTRNLFVVKEELCWS